MLIFPSSIPHSGLMILVCSRATQSPKCEHWTINTHSFTHSLTKHTERVSIKKKNGIKSTRPISARTLYQKSKKENGKNTKILLIKFTILFITLLNALFLYWLFIISYFSLDNVGWALSLRAYEYFNVSGNKSPLD